MYSKKQFYFNSIFRNIISLLIIFFVITSCSKKLHNQNVANVIVYPAPPDTARIQYLTTINSSENFNNKKSAFSSFVVGKEKAKGIIKPYGMAINDSKIYICDLDLPGLEIIDLKSGSFDYFVPRGLGQLQSPINCFVDSDGFLYVTDIIRSQVVVFDKELNYVDSFGELENFRPNDVYVTEENIWVANLKNKINVYKRDSTYQLLYSFPNTEKGEEGHLYQPTNIYVTQDAIYASDFGESNIKVYTHEGLFVRAIGSYGRNLGQFVRPKGIAVDQALSLYVVDAAFENVQIFNKKDQLLMFFGGNASKGSGDMWLPSKVIIDYENIKYFEKYVDKRFNLKYIILVSNSFGPNKINVYGFIEPK